MFFSLIFLFRTKSVFQTGKFRFSAETVACLLCFSKFLSAESTMYLVKVQSKTKKIKAALLTASLFCGLITVKLNIKAIKEAFEIGCFTVFIKMQSGKVLN